MFDKRFHSAQARPPRKELNARRDPHRGSFPARDLEREHPAERLHLFLGDAVTGMRRQTGIMHPFDLGLRPQEFDDLARVVAVGAHPVGEGAEAPQHQPAVER